MVSVEDQADSDDLAVESFYRSAGTSIDRVVHMIDGVTRTRKLVGLTVGTLLRLLDQFQEWPQLLDPFLQRIVSQCSSLLADIHLSGQNPELSAPISQILYVLCKVRGRKVVVKFFRNDAQLLQPLILFFAPCFDKTHPVIRPRSWEEEFIGLLWLGYMMTGAFSLTLAVDEEALTLDPADHDEDLDRVDSKILQALVYIARFYLDSAGQQRAAAGVMLGQLVRRRDAQAATLHSILMQWSIRMVEDEDFEASVLSYRVVGHLAFWAQYVKAAKGESKLKSQVADLWRQYVADAVVEQSKLRLLTNQTCILKVIRYMAEQTAWPDHDPSWEDMIQVAIGALFEELENPTTMVRFAAGKALGHVVAGLPNTHAADAVDFLFSNVDPDEELRGARRPLYDHKLNHHSTGSMGPDQTVFSAFSHDLLHGSLLSLAHMIMLRAVPAGCLAPSCRLAIVALSFSQISAAGTLIGENVRDAACWCVWALARKYTDAQELWSGSTSYLQTLATELTQVACLDPTNNIRRAASAALQELIGRNPNKIRSGLELSTVVDSAGVSAASTGMLSTAPRVAQLSIEYWQVILLWLTSWRGLAHNSISIRRKAAQSIGMVSLISPEHAEAALRRLIDCSSIAEERTHTTRHGIVMALAAIVQAIHDRFDERTEVGRPQEALSEADGTKAAFVNFGISSAEDLLDIVRSERAYSVSYRNNIDAHNSYEEAICTLIRNLMSLELRTYSHPSEHARTTDNEIQDLLEQVCEVFENPEKRLRDIALKAASFILELANAPARSRLVTQYTEALSGELPSIWVADSYLRLVGLTYHLFIGSDQRKTTDHIYQEQVKQIMVAVSNSNDTRLKQASVHAIRAGPFDSGQTDDKLMNVVMKCLDDYTNDSKRGDIGWDVRSEAVQTASFALSQNLLHGEARDRAIAKICGLAVESSDKMRLNVATVLARQWETFRLLRFCHKIDRLDSSSIAYFKTFLKLSVTLPHGREIMQGYVTSASSKAANTVCFASRMALRVFVHELSLSHTANPILALIPENLGSKTLPWPARLSVPWTETLEYLLSLALYAAANDSQPIDPKILHNIFATTTRAHYQSYDLRLLDAAVGLYYEIANLATIAASSLPTSDTRDAYLKVRKEVLVKLCSMLGHKFAKTRDAVADALYLILEDEEMLNVDFSKSPSGNKGDIQRIRSVVEALG